MDKDLVIWRENVNLREQGVLIASDKDSEIWVKWWYFNYTKWNSFPVAIADLGISEMLRSWCLKRLEVIPFEPHLKLIDKARQQKLGPISYLKPFALLKSPFRKTLWIDTDCLVMGSVSPLFEIPSPPHFASMATEQSLGKNTNIPDETKFNDSVIPFFHGSQLILRWAKEMFSNEEIKDDAKTIFSNIVNDDELEIPPVPQKYNWIVENQGFSKNAVIANFTGKARGLGEVLVKDFYRVAVNFRES